MQFSILKFTGRHPDDGEGSVEGGEGDGGKSAMLLKKGKESVGSKKGLTKKEKPKCVESCKPGRNSGCPIKTKGRGKTSNNVGCADIDKMLEALGVDAKNASLCTKAAIMRGHIEITGEEGDLEKVVFKNKGFFCGHKVEATLGDLLKQPDYAWPDYELKNATVICKVFHLFCFGIEKFSFTNESTNSFSSRHVAQTMRMGETMFPTFARASPGLLQ